MAPSLTEELIVPRSNMRDSIFFKFSFIVNKLLVFVKFDLGVSMLSSANRTKFAL